MPSGKPSSNPSGKPSAKPSSKPSAVACVVTEVAIDQADFNTRITNYKATLSYVPDINTWNTAEVTDTSYIFNGCTAQSPNMKCWNLAKVALIPGIQQRLLIRHIFLMVVPHKALI